MWTKWPWQYVRIPNKRTPIALSKLPLITFVPNSAKVSLPLQNEALWAHTVSFKGLIQHCLECMESNISNVSTLLQDSYL